MQATLSKNYYISFVIILFFIILSLSSAYALLSSIPLFLSSSLTPIFAFIRLPLLLHLLYLLSSSSPYSFPLVVFCFSSSLSLILAFRLSLLYLLLPASISPFYNLFLFFHHFLLLFYSFLSFSLFFASSFFIFASLFLSLVSFSWLFFSNIPSHTAMHLSLQELCFYSGD